MIRPSYCTGEITKCKFTCCRLDKNGLSGTIPPQIALIDGLRHVDLRDNSLEGPVPRSLGMVSATLGSLWLAGNPLGDSIPSEFGLVQQLHELDLSRTKLRGSTPTGALARPACTAVKSADPPTNPFPRNGNCKWIETTKFGRKHLVWDSSNRTG